MMSVWWFHTISHFWQIFMEIESNYVTASKIMDILNCTQQSFTREKLKSANYVETKFWRFRVETKILIHFNGCKFIQMSWICLLNVYEMRTITLKYSAKSNEIFSIIIPSRICCNKLCHYTLFCAIYLWIFITTLTSHTCNILKSWPQKYVTSLIFLLRLANFQLLITSAPRYKRKFSVKIICRIDHRIHWRVNTATRLIAESVKAD